MTCHSLMDRIYDFDGENALPLLIRLEIAVHVILCPRCAGEIVRLEAAREILRTDFFPPAPVFDDAVMERIAAEAFDMVDMPFQVLEPAPEVPFGGWVITGLVVLISLASSFIGMDFARVANAQGSSFLVPVGITIGLVVSGYGAIFIGSHLKELSDRFRLH